MPFKVGPDPIRFTIKYLTARKVHFRDYVRIFAVNYNIKGEHHEGAKQFVYWHLPQIQYLNPLVQCLTLINLTPSPFIQIFMDDGKKILIDLDSRKKEEIISHVENFTAICKSPEELDIKGLKHTIKNPANFGYECPRHCMCEILDQVPCPRLVPIPKVMHSQAIHERLIEEKENKLTTKKQQEYK